MGVQIRKAEKRDLDAIGALATKQVNYHVKIDGYYKKSSVARSKRIKKHLSKTMKKKTTLFLVAEDNGKIIGYFIGFIVKSSPYLIPTRIGKISEAYLDNKYRRRGIGSKMVKEYIKWFKKNRIKYIELYVDSRNLIGVSAWKKFGFKEYMKRMRMDL